MHAGKSSNYDLLRTSVCEQTNRHSKACVLEELRQLFDEQLSALKFLAQIKIMDRTCCCDSHVRFGMQAFVVFETLSDERLVMQREGVCCACLRICVRNRENGTNALYDGRAPEYKKCLQKITMSRCANRSRELKAKRLSWAPFACCQLLALMPFCIFFQSVHISECAQRFLNSRDFKSRKFGIFAI